MCFGPQVAAVDPCSQVILNFAGLRLSSHTYNLPCIVHTPNRGRPNFQRIALRQ